MKGVVPLRGRTLEILSQEELAAVHQATLDVLEEPGVLIKSQRALKILEAAGAKVDNGRQIARLPRFLVEEAIRTAPYAVTLCGRDPRHDVSFGSGRVHFLNGYGTINIFDSQTGEVRVATKQDLENVTRIQDVQPHAHMLISEITPQDVPRKVVDRHIAQAMLRSTQKHCLLETYSLGGAKDLIRMGAAVSGGREELKRRPIVSGFLCAVSPLIMDEGAAECLIEFCEFGLPVLYWSLPQAGGTSPATIAGTLVIQNADILAGLVLAQAVRPGSPIIYGSYGSIMDQKYGCFVTAGPEVTMLVAATAQLMRFYKLPHVGTCGSTESNLLDIQAGYEKATTMLFSALSGAEVIHGAVSGWVESIMTCCYEQIIVANEMCDMVYRILRGIEVNPETLAVDVIRQVGAGGNFLTQRHTRQHFRQEHWLSGMTNRLSRGEWVERGSRELLDVARQEVARILESPSPAILSAAVEEELAEIVCEAEKNYA